MATWLVVLVSVLGGWAVIGIAALVKRRLARRAFDAEYRRLVATTPIDLNTVRRRRRNLSAERRGAAPVTRATRQAVGPDDAPSGTPSDTPSGTPSGAPSGTPAPLTDSDRDYYTTCWRHIQGTFAYSPIVALDLAERLTGNLLRTRRLAAPRADNEPGSGAEPGADADLRNPAGRRALPSAWAYLTARRTAAQALRLQPSDRVMREALEQYKQYFDDVMALPPSPSAEG